MTSAEAGGVRNDQFHVIHKVPAGDTPYSRAKHLQLVEKDLEGSIVWFWKAINAGDRVDSALKDMAVVMKQRDRAEEGIEAIKSFRHLCSKQSQESLDNRCGRIEEQIELLMQKLRMISTGDAFNGKTTKTARSHGKKFQVSIKQETARVLGNLGWAYMQKGNYVAAETVYRKAQEFEADANKACNLSLSLMKQHRYAEARDELDAVLQRRLAGSDEPKTVKRAAELLQEMESRWQQLFSLPTEKDLEKEIAGQLELLVNGWTPLRSRRLPIFEEIDTYRDQIAC
ncbi:hypothetical protein Taro_009418 [Colocasia esculenta]|uniref:Uncharacterized protein n=1 Tax=Colocasia esculenta TaxID=4460 RepID=A0A843U0C3_COLES|nr:hypothetical protein [Colocasia esculenta]